MSKTWLRSVSALWRPGSSVGRADATCTKAVLAAGSIPPCGPLLRVTHTPFLSNPTAVLSIMTPKKSKKKIF